MVKLALVVADICFCMLLNLISRAIRGVFKTTDNLNKKNKHVFKMTK